MTLQVKKNKDRRVPRCSVKFKTREELGEKYVVDTEDKQDMKTRIRNLRLSGVGIPENWRANRVQDLRASKQEILDGRNNVIEQWNKVPASLKVKVKQEMNIDGNMTPEQFISAFPGYVAKNKQVADAIAKNTPVEAPKDAPEINPNEVSGTPTS